MSHDIDILREEAQALLQLEQQLLSQMSAQGILDQSDEVNDQAQATLDTESIKQEEAILRGEALKVSELEMVLAVVGTMKAGKSTTINAIVGTEILPNRNAPMTAIPTMIKHLKGQKQPRLRFTPQASQPANQLVQDLRSAFKNNQYAAVLENLKSDQDLYRTVEKIQQGAKVVNEALGEKQIFDFLVSINDLVRIAPRFDLEFPFDQYQEVDQLPVIEVEFAHLQDMEEQGGKLILLDTPGPNEAGQAHLRPMLQDQLKKASAVLAVMDYTQLKSEADAQVREDLQGIANTVKNRIYALVNKFDNCDRNGMQEDEVKAFVEGLTEGLIQKESVYPVAAKIGYLANRARHERLEDGSLPSVNEDTAWVEDFYQEARLRREENRTPARIAEAIEDLWKDSRLSHPLKEVIEESHKKAAFVALDSAVDKLEECSEKINIVLSVKQQAVSKSAEGLQTVITQLEQDIKSIDGAQSKAEESIQTLQSNFSDTINEFIAKQFSFVKENIINLTLGGHAISVKIVNEELKTKKEEQKKMNGFVKLKYKIMKICKVQKFELKTRIDEYIPPTYDPKNPIIDFGRNEDAAKQFLKQVDDLLPQVNDLVNQQVEVELDTLLNAFELKYRDEIIEQAQKTIQQINSSLNQGGFEDIILNLPHSKTLTLKLSGAKIMQDAIIEESRQEKRTRVMDSRWGRFQNWINDDWGTESYVETVREYKVDMDKIQRQIEYYLKENQKLLIDSVSKNIEQPLVDATLNFFSDFKRKVSGLTRDIENSLRGKEQSRQNESDFLNTISSMKKTCQDIQERTQQLKGIVSKSL